jgi:uncharacterized protein (TIGR03437 family)
MGAATGCTVDPAGNIYFSSASEDSVFRIDKRGVLILVAGGAAASTPLNSPQGLAMDKSGNLYIADSGSSRVLQLSTSGTITTFAGNGVPGYGGDGGPATSAQLNHPAGVAIDLAGNLYIADQGNYRIRMVSPSGIITTFAGDGDTGYGLGDGGPAISGNISFAGSVAVDSQGNLYIADRMDSRVRMVRANGMISTVAGNGSFSFGGDGGQATAAQLNQPSAVAMDSSGNRYIADSGNSRIRVVSPSGTISTIAGTGTQGYSGDNGPATSARIAVWGLTVDSTGNLYLYGGDSRIRKIAAGGTITTIEGGVALPASAVALQAQLQFPEGLATDPSGNLYFAETGNHVVRKLGTDGTLTIVAGNGAPGYAGDGGSAVGAQLNGPAAVAVDSNGNLYISDSGNNVIRRVTPGQAISTIAGGGTNVCPGSGSAAGVGLLDPAGLAVDSQGDLYIADSGHGCVLEITPAGQVSTIAGGSASVSDVFLSDQTTANSTTLYLPEGVAVDSSGNVYIADTGNACIRKVKPDGTIAVVAGNGIFGYSGDGGAATGAQLSAPWSVAYASGNLYIADTVNQRVREVATDGTITTIAGNGVPGYSGDGGAAKSAQLNTPWSVAVDSNGNVYISDWGNQAIRELKAETAQASVYSRPASICGADRGSPDAGLDWFDPVSAPLTPPIPGAAGLAAAGDSALAGSGLPPFRPDSMPSPAGGTYAPGPDADFSYLSLLQPDLTFVQDIQRSVDLAASLGAMADSMQGSGGASLLALRAQVLQYASGQAWQSMWAEAINGDLPEVMDYETALGHEIKFYETFVPTATNNVWTPTGLADLRAFLNLIPPPLLQFEQAILNGPVAFMMGYGSYTLVGRSVTWTGIEGNATAYNGSLGHEIGLSVFSGLGASRSPLIQEWDSLWAQSVADPMWDDCYELVYPRPPSANPWGAMSEFEDFATIFGNWVGDSATPRLNPNESSSVPEEAIYRASLGHPILLEKTLLVASLFTDPSTLQLSLYYHQGYQNGNTLERVLAPVSSASSSLTLGDYTFTVVNGALTGVTSPASQAQFSGQTVNIPALSYTFPTPVPVPGFAAAAWGIPQVPTGSGPSINAGGVVNAAYYRAPVAPGSIASAFGNFLLTSSAADANLPLSTGLLGLSLEFGGGTLAPLFYASGGQVNLQVPWELAGQSRTTLAATLDGLFGAAQTVNLAPFAPAIFTTNGQGTGPGAILDSSYRLVGSSNPTTAGAVVQIYCTGLGEVTNRPATGSPAPTDSLVWTATTPTVMIGGAQANVQFSGLAPGAVGLYQVNAYVPAGSATGPAVPVVISVSGAASNTVTMAVQ